jgi:hypothetical protein
VNLISDSRVANFGGTIADLFPSTQTGPAMSIFLWAATSKYLFDLSMRFELLLKIVKVGSPSGYFLFAFVAATKGLRSVFWAILGISGGFWIIMILTLRETRHSIILSQRHKHERKAAQAPLLPRLKQATNNLYQKALKRPFVFLCTEAIVQFCTLYNGYLYGLSFLFNIAFVIIFGKEGHGFETIDTGLCFLGICVGISIGPITTAMFQERYFQKILKRRGGVACPEDRVHLGKIAGVMFPVSLFWFGWTSYRSIHVNPPLLIEEYHLGSKKVLI